MRRALNLLASVVIVSGAVVLLQPSRTYATQSTDTCCVNPDEGPCCEGETCCADSSACYTDKQICEAMFCHNNPEAPACKPSPE